MKKKSASILISTIITITILTVLFDSCKPSAPVSNADVNKQLEMNPPLAQNIIIKQLDKETEDGNVLVSAHLPGIREQFHARMVGEEKMVLRDDGLRYHTRETAF